MKKGIAILGLAVTMMACGGNGTQEAPAVEETAVVVDSTATVSETTEVEAPASESTEAVAE